ncbi:hypothetical protein LIER_21953 [Lithospermum erythrorhizon]|uniref:Uncharacterized protein n=1 Tax=Lithospermum erythrorhizon TaxID=34254 RepID=A0AAV3QV61_LITER
MTISLEALAMAGVDYNEYGMSMKKYESQEMDIPPHLWANSPDDEYSGFWEIERWDFKNYWRHDHPQLESRRRSDNDEFSRSNDDGDEKVTIGNKVRPCSWNSFERMRMAKKFSIVLEYFCLLLYA